MGPSGAILASDDLIRYTFSVVSSNSSAGGFGGRLFWLLTGRFSMVSVPKIGRCKPVAKGKVGADRITGKDGCCHHLFLLPSMSGSHAP
jgi:hypothetical protein